MITFVFFKQKTAYEMRISDWSSDVCSSDLYPCSMIDKDEERLNRQLDRFERELPRGVARSIRWLREPSSRWLRIPAGLALILGGIFSIQIGRASCRERVCQYV